MKPSDAIWPYKTGPTLAPLLPCSMMVPSYYLNQCWLIISGVQCRQLLNVALQLRTLIFHSNLPVAISNDPLQWRHNGRDRFSNHQPHDCLLNRLFRRRSKKTSKLRVTGLCAVNSPGTGEFPAQMASYAENVSIWWRHHDLCAEFMCGEHGRDLNCPNSNNIPQSHRTLSLKLKWK